MKRQIGQNITIFCFEYFASLLSLLSPRSFITSAENHVLLILLKCPHVIATCTITTDRTITQHTALDNMNHCIFRIIMFIIELLFAI